MRSGGLQSNSEGVPSIFSLPIFNVQIICAQRRKSMELEKMRGISNFPASLAPDPSHRDYVIKSLKGERRHNNLILDDKK